MELEDEPRKKLIIWAKRKGYTNDYENACLSIGQMIEFLDQNNSTIIEFVLDDYRQIMWRRDVELCDSLWEACKEVLNTV